VVNFAVVFARISRAIIFQKHQLLECGSEKEEWQSLREIN
jgi:hypothetical protein